MVWAAVVLPILFLVLWFFTLDGEIDERVAQLANYGEAHGLLLVTAIFVNFGAISLSLWMLAMALGFGRLGSKINQFKQSRVTGFYLTVLQRLPWVVAGGSLGFYIHWANDLYLALFPLPKVIPHLQAKVFECGLVFSSLSLGAFVGAGACQVFKWILNWWGGGIPAVPIVKNQLILGTKVEADREEWILLGKNALCTGIMVTAATGGGKSRSCLIPWAKQFMTNFEPFPSICVIDPKDSFAKSVLSLAEELKQQERVIHFTLDGRFKTNPIFRPNMLKESGFMHVAGMIKAATVNFMGKEEGDQKFWGSKGTTLIKNLLIYCAAKFGGYFTLRDFYQEMIEVGEREFSLEIQGFLESKDYDWEERRNLEIAGDYFEREFVGLDSKLKDSIAQTASSFLSQIREARVERVFCPPKEEINFSSFDEIVDEGKIFVFGIDVPGLAGPLSVLMKLMYQRSVMDRIIDRKRLESGRLAVSIYDEYQTFVSLGGGQIEGDEDYAAKRREALGATVIATQSHSSLLQATGDEVGTDVLIQHYRTRIIGNTTDVRTINHYKEIGGEVEEQVETESYTESGQKPGKWLFGKGLVTTEPTVSQSLNRNAQRRPRINGENLSRLKTFEAMGLIYNGVDSEIVEKIGLKPSFFPTMRVTHKKVIEFARKAAVACLVGLASKATAFPSVCSAVKSAAFDLCTEHVRSPCTCPGIPPRPCVRHSYYVPFSFVEVTSRPKVSFFADMPGASGQLAAAGETLLASGSVEMDNRFFQARVIQVPWMKLAYSKMPCGEQGSEKLCFDAMSEHISTTWKSGVSDREQPQFKLWAANVKACYVKGAASALTGRVNKGSPSSMPTCSFEMSAMKVFPPVLSDVCGGWGILLPRTGFVESNSATGAALLAAQRIRSVANEVYRSSPIYPSEKWQMIFPQGSSCFREGQSLGPLENTLGVNEIGRLKSMNHDSYLFVIWKQVSCCKDLNSVASGEAAKIGMRAMCQGVP